MMEFIRDGGWGMYPVLLFGAIALALAARHAIRPTRQTLTLVIGFAIVTLISGALGATIGLQRSLEALPRVAAERRWIFLLGLRESLNDFVASLIVACIVGLTTTIGSYRLASANARVESKMQRAA